MSGRLDHLRREPERGNIIVLFALFLTVVIALGSIVLDVGNWFVLKRHLQTQVDAAALAGGPGFTWCTQDENLARTAITQESLKYAGDPTREAMTDNQLMEDTGDVHVVLNSNTYWATGDKTDGSTLDWTSGAACTAKYLDVKATDEDAPLLWGWIPFYPDLKTRARVEISQIQSTNGLRPLGVPEVDPEQVGVLFVNEDGDPNLVASVRGSALLTEQTTPPTGLESMAVWSKSAISPVGIDGGRNFNAIVVTSRSPIPLVLTGRTVSDICNANPTQVHCYGGDDITTDGLSFIHAYSTTGSGSATSPIIRGVTLDGGCTSDLSRPYFNFEGGCPIGITATIDFDTGGNDPAGPVASGGVCAVVTASPGGPMTWAGGVWKASFPTAATPPGGPIQVNLTWSTDTNGPCTGPNNGNGTFTKATKAYVSSEESGPVEYITVEHAGGGSANSMPNDATASFNVTVGLTAPLRNSALTDPPIPLRFWGAAASQTQALDCDTSGASGWGEAMQVGCTDPYQIYDEAKHTTKCGPPPAGVPAADPPDCIDAETGNFQQKPVIDLLTTCAQNPNRWDGMTIPPASDKRWMPLFVLDQLAFEVPGKRTYPIRRFGMFYVTAVTGMNCPGDVPIPLNGSKREMWGHFLSYIIPGLGETIPSTVPCSFENGTLCVSNLVE